MFKELYLKKLSKKWILIVCLISPVLLGNEDKFDQDDKTKILKNVTSTDHERYDIEIRAPYYMLSMKLKGEKVYRPFKIYNDYPIEKVEWHPQDRDILIVMFFDRSPEYHNLRMKIN
jgi:hypothetical protein